MAIRLHRGVTEQVTISNVTIDGSYGNAGAASWDVYAANGVSLANGSMSYITGSTGNYSGNIANTVTANLAKGIGDYELGVRFFQSPDADMRREIIEVVDRGRT